MERCLLLYVMAALFVCCTRCAALRAAAPEAALLYVATNGNDAWSGRLPAPNAAKTDGPFATIPRARDAIRELKRPGKLASPVTVQVRGGTYRIAKPISFTPADSGSPDQPVRYVAYPGEEPVLCGGREITGWRPHKRGIYVADARDLDVIYALQGRDVALAERPCAKDSHPHYARLLVSHAFRAIHATARPQRHKPSRQPARRTACCPRR